MADLPALYPAACYLLPLEKRLRYRDAGGRLDPSAVASAARLLPFASGLDATHKARVGALLGRIQKAVIAFGDAAASGALDESFGFPILIEVPEGGTRSGVGAAGPWSSTMTGASYGFLPGTCGADREEVDVFKGPVPAAQAPLAFVYTQVGSDPERKLMVGFATAADAIRVVMANVPAEMFGDLHALPLAIIGELLGYEPEAPGALAKALEAGTATAGASVLITKSGATVASFTRVEVESDAAIQKSAVTVGTFASGGVLLSGPGKARSHRAKTLDAVRCAVDPIRDAAAARLGRALGGAVLVKSTTAPVAPLSSYPALADHPALTSPFSGTYENPADVGGWLGWIEDEPETWIAFVDTEGKALLWTSREEDGGVIGAPVSFTRPDLAGAAPEVAASKATPMLPAASVGYYTGPDAAPVDPTDNTCPICRTPWTSDDVRTYSLLALEGPASDKSLFYRTHRTCAEAAPDTVIEDLDRQAMDHAAAGRLIGQGETIALAKSALRKSFVDSATPSTKTAVSLPVRILPITKGLDASTPKEKRVVIGVVLEPEPFDGAGDAHDETYSAEEIERAAFRYCASYRNLNDSHGRFISNDRAEVVQTYVAPQDLVIGGTVIKAGAWVLAAKIYDDVLWGRVLTGELGAWSIEGYAERTPNVGPPLAPTMAA